MFSISNDIAIWILYHSTSHLRRLSSRCCFIREQQICWAAWTALWYLHAHSKYSYAIISLSNRRLFQSSITLSTCSNCEQYHLKQMKLWIMSEFALFCHLFLHFSQRYYLSCALDRIQNNAHIIHLFCKCGSIPYKSIGLQ